MANDLFPNCLALRSQVAELSPAALELSYVDLGQPNRVNDLPPGQEFESRSEASHLATAERFTALTNPLESVVWRQRQLSVFARLDHLNVLGGGAWRRQERPMGPPTIEEFVGKGVVATGSAIRLIRQHAGIAQEELGRVVGLRRTGDMEEVENGSRSLSYDELRGIAEGLQVRLSTLFEIASLRYKPLQVLVPLEQEKESLSFGPEDV